MIIAILKGVSEVQLKRTQRVRESKTYDTPINNCAFGAFMYAENLKATSVLTCTLRKSNTSILKIKFEKRKKQTPCNGRLFLDIPYLGRLFASMTEVGLEAYPGFKNEAIELKIRR